MEERGLIQVFVGVDKRQMVAYHVLCHSIMQRSSHPVSFTPLLIDQLPITRKGLTDFTYARYLVPWLCRYMGQGIFLDSDMLVLGDIAELHSKEAVSFVHRDGDLAFERPSVMVFNNNKCGQLTPEYIGSGNPQSFEWADTAGHLDPSWNRLVGYEPIDGAKLLHFTMGVPAYKECRHHDGAELWQAEYESMIDHCSWLEIMGTSVHAPKVLEMLKCAR